MTTQAPDRSAQQRAEALRIANHVRATRGQLKATWKQLGKRAAADAFARVVADPAPELCSMKVAELLMAIPQFGKQRLRVTMLRLQISYGKTVGGLSPRQRRELVEWAEVYGR